MTKNTNTYGIINECCAFKMYLCYDYFLSNTILRTIEVTSKGRPIKFDSQVAPITAERSSSKIVSVRKKRHSKILNIFIKLIINSIQDE